MTQFTPLIICNENHESNNVSSVLDFDNKEIDLFGFNNQQVLESFISNILTSPQVLQTHIQRIYFCYQYDLADDLFAALVDFLIVLEGKGQAIQSRMVNGAKPKLQQPHYAILKNALKLPANEVKLLKGNLYSVLTQGLIGVSVLIEKERQKHQFSHDPLDLARDYVAYSQLDMAMKTLEDAIMLDFERLDLHYDLLELYKLTHSEDKFLIMYTQLSKQFQSIPSAWEKLKGFFYE